MEISLGNFMGELSTSTSQVMDSVAPVATLILGILLAFFVIEKVVTMLSKEDRIEGR